MAEKFKPHFEGEKYETVRKILPCNVHWKARDDLLKNECDRQGSTTVTMLIPLCKEIAKFQHLCWTTLRDSAYIAHIKFLTDGTQTKRFTDTPYLQKMAKSGGAWYVET